VTVPPQIAVTRFAAFGDSITVGTDGQNTITTSFGGPLLFRNHAILYGSEYPTVLQQMLKSRYTTQACQIGVTNLGFAGEPAGELPPDYPGITALQRFQNEVIGKSYQSVLIMEGSNDTYFAYNAPSQSAQTAMLQAAAANIRKMVQLARGNGLRPYLATIPPQNRNACVPICRGYGHELVAPYNDLIRGVALTEGAPLVDVFQAFNGDLSLLSPDGLHPNAAGFERIADTFFNAVKNTIEVPATAPSACTN
jgi:lysophospholipase L1-like esterase